MQVIVLALVLGGAHALISVTTNQGSTINVWLTVFIFVSDFLLGIFVDPF